MSTLLQMVKEIAFYYAKHHYNEYLKNNNVTFINKDKIYEIVDKFYTEESKKEIREYIRRCLKETLQDNYNSFAVEGVLMEMFTHDTELSKNRISLEIEYYQSEILGIL